MKDDSTYGKYPLDQIRQWISDAMESEYTPEEIYDCIITTVKENMRYQKACYNTSVKLLSLLRGNENGLRVIDGNDNYDDNYNNVEGKSEWAKYWNGELYGKEFEDALKKYGYAYTPIDEEERERFRLNSPFLNNNEEVDD